MFDLQGLGDVESAAVIVIVITINAILGTVQTVKAEQSLQSLKKLSGPEAKVLRDGSAVQIPARELVIGDVILLEAGDMIPADGRLIENASLKVDESALTISCRTVSRSHNSGLHVCCYIEYIKNAIHVQTMLIGPKEENLKDEPSYPYLVIRMEYRDEPVIFE